MKTHNIKKLYYSISEISEMLDIKQSVIRYWESEFKELSPQKNRAGNRIFKKDDIPLLRLLHYYIHGKHLSISETRDMIQHLKTEGLYKRKLDELEAEAEKNRPVIRSAEPAESPEDAPRFPKEDSPEAEEDEDAVIFPPDEAPEILRPAEEPAPQVPVAEPVRTPEPPSVPVQDDALRSEMRELLQKISANIRDIIGILNEEKP